MTDRERNTLKPCPFCGSEAKSIECLGNRLKDGPPWYEKQRRIVCSALECSGAARPADIEEQAVENWNTRPAPITPAQAARVLGIDRLAESLIERDGHKITLTVDPHYCWPDGLQIPLNDPPDGEMLQVAHLDVEDSGFGPEIWHLGLIALRAIAEQEEKDNEQIT